MPFDSKAQMRAAFGGHLGKEMKSKAHEFAEKTNMSKLPERAKEKMTDRMNRVIGGAQSIAKKSPAVKAGVAAGKAAAKALRK